MSTAHEPVRRGRLTVAPPGPGRRPPGRGRFARRTRRLDPVHVGLAVLLVLTLGLRLWGIRQGLPFSYNADEAEHFLPKAVQFLGGDWNPHYFLNPPAYSYLLAIVFELWFGSADAVTRAYTLDPSALFLIARVVAAILGTLAVWLLYGAGVRLLVHRAAALLAAAIFGCAFLPVFYSHLALNDVPTLFGVCLGLYGAAGVWQAGRGVDYLVAGVGVGLAAATKYTGGWVVVVLVVAATASATRRPGPREGVRTLVWSAAALLTALAAFSLANPYWFLDFSGFTAGVAAQAAAAAGSPKLGSGQQTGILYYLWTFSWGFGLGPALAALAGVALLLRRRRWWLLACLVPGQIAFIVFMGLQARFFGRWLMPIFPTVALLAGYAGVELIRWSGRLPRPLPPIFAAASVTVALLGQSLTSVLHSDRVLSRPYTTNLARAWMIAHIPAGENVYIEPVIPGNWSSTPGVANAFEPDGARWYQYPTQISNLGANGRPLPAGRERYVTLDEYETTLYPGLIARLEANAFCWVVSGTLQSGRAFVAPDEAPGAVAYYRRLAHVGRLVYRVSPYRSGANPVPFNFDWAIDYEPPQYRLPGPVISIYHLSGGACRE
ncbi:glycosyltransferase family 39 protein [Conexibacter sp. DBS9H8]|uniref:ArnT family glycosyltransferase n=1 Tax=Conexibacter sp. DBS9H8 TaxID=2937801 RepID=UPI00200F139B|nr:glycosyltransferase family 39 protein [Conexibacter sp. DBS9H8]